MPGLPSSSCSGAPSVPAPLKVNGSEEGHRHYLRRNDGTSTPQQLVFVDCLPNRCYLGNERVRFGERLLCGSACRVRLEAGELRHLEWIDFARWKDFWKWMEVQFIPGRAPWLVGYGLGRQLVWLRWHNLVDRGWFTIPMDDVPAPEELGAEGPADRPPKGMYVDDDPPFICKARRKRSGFTLVDLRNYWNEPFRKIAELAGSAELPKPGELAELAECQRYCARRAQICADAFTALVRWWHKEDLGHFRYTTPGLALAAFRHRFMKDKILTDYDSFARGLGRASLLGGEVRCGYVGPVLTAQQQRAQGAWAGENGKVWSKAGPVYVLDCNSLYPAVMRDNLYPLRYQCYKRPAELEDVRAWRPYLSLVAHVELESTTHTYPVRRDEQTFFPLGRFDATLAGPELLAAVDRGHVRRVHALAAYGQGKPFKGYVDWFYARRLFARDHLSEAEDRFYKLLLNALPGKLSQRSGGWKLVNLHVGRARWGEFDYWLERYEKIVPGRVVAGYPLLRLPPEELTDGFPLITAFVCSYARLEMERRRALLPPGSFLYQDTDSLHVTEEGYRALKAAGLVDTDELGAFKVEGVYQTGEYRGWKDYTLDGTHVISGRKETARDLRPGMYIQDEFQGLEELLKRRPKGFTFGAPVVKRYGVFHPRGRRGPEGLVTPLVLWDGRWFRSGRRRLPWEPKPARKRKGCGP